jgi:L-threonylcarbamoyladenylate synthase
MSLLLKNITDPTEGRIIGSSSQDIILAAQCLLKGALVGLPTETVYGLAADATQGEAVARIYEAKGRPQFNPLISHVASLSKAMEHGIFDATAKRLAEAFWPGPLTLVVPFRAGSPVSDLARAGLHTIALRVPSHPVALELLKAVERPLAAPSANLSGRISPTTAQDVINDLGNTVSLVLDGGACVVGVESTVIACHEGHVILLRPGGITRESIEAVLGHTLAQAIPGQLLRSPGLLESHYAPLAPVRMNARQFHKYDAILAFGASDLHKKYPLNPFVNLSLDGNLRQAASQLFSALRELDDYHPAAIAVAPIPSHGLGEAINDRLSRAAAPRNYSAFDS